VNLSVLPIEFRFGHEFRQATLLVWIDNGIHGAEDFIEWGGALDRSDIVRDRLLRDGRIDVT
jgi:hypothetical protein